MTFLKTVFAATALSTMAPLGATAAAAQPAGVTTGMEVVNGDQRVGTVVTADDQFITVRTDRHEVPLPVASFTPHEGKLLFGMTAAQLNAAVDANMAEAEASVAVGKPVKDVAGLSVGTIDEIGDDYVQLELASGKVVRVPVDGLQKDAGGAIALYNVADLQAQAVERPDPEVGAAYEIAADAETDADATVETDPHAGHDMSGEGSN